MQDFWATDTRKICGKSRMRATYSTSRIAGNPFKLSPAIMCLYVGLSFHCPLRPFFFLLRLISAPEIQEFSLS